MTDASATTTRAARTGTAASFARRLLAPIALIILAATALDLGLYALGRAIGAVMVLDPANGVDPNHELTAWDVAWKTVVFLGAGVVVVLPVAWRSRRGAIALVWLAAVLGLGSGIAAASGAHDVATGWVLLGMHAVGAAAGVLIALLALRRLSPARAGSAPRR